MRQGIKISEADRLFSIYIRTINNWTCERCHRKYPPPTTILQNSHFFGRTRKSVRFDPENCDALCFGCHRFWETEDREGYREFKIKKLGQKRYDLLVLRANTPARPDEKMIIIFCKQFLLKQTLANPKNTPVHL